MTAVIIIFFVLGAFLFLVRCTEGTYRVDYGGQKDLYKGAKDSYKAGREVTLYYMLIATDTDYFFYLDGEPIDFDYDDKKGFIIRFIMPDHNVKLECRAKESMTYVPPCWDVEAGVMLLNCYRAIVASADGDGYHELVITTTNDPEEVRLDEYIKEGHEEKQTTFYISYQVVQELLLLIDKYGLSEWNDLEDGFCIDGAKKVCTFWDGKEHIRVSTDHMPEDGEKKLDTLFELLENYANDGSL